MKILIVSPYFHPCIGGLENYALAIASNLSADGHEIVVVASSHDSRRQSKEEFQGLRIIRLVPLFVLSNTPVNPLWYFQLRTIVKDERPDAVIAHTPVPFIADMAARAAGRLPFILTYHNDLVKDSAALNALLWVYWKALGNATMSRADRIIATSEAYSANSPYLRTFSAKTTVIPPGVDSSRFNRQVDSSPVRNRFPGKQIVLFVGSLSKTHTHKGLEILIRSVARLKQNNPYVHLIVVGAGDNLSHYQQLTLELSLDQNVTFTGFVADEELPIYYAASDVFVLPSTNRAEGLGMVLIEAAACGSPVIGTNVGGIPAAMAMIGSENIAEPNETSISMMIEMVLASEASANLPRSVRSWKDAARATHVAIEKARRPRVALIHNVISPYRSAMFEELSATCNLEVLFAHATTDDRKWKYDLDHCHFSYRILSSFCIGPIVINPTGALELKRSRFEVLITNTDPDTAPISLMGLALAKILRRPILLWSEVTDDAVQTLPKLAYATGGPLLVAGRVASWFVMAYRQIFFHAARMSIAFSDEAKSFLISNGVNASTILRSFEVMPKELMPPALLSRPRDGKTFLYVGYFNTRKNVSLLVKAFARVADPEAKLVIAGTGSEEEQLRTLAASDKRVKFVGYIEDQAKAQTYEACDVLILPTQRDCWGLVVNEAIHYGLGVIVSDAAGASELVNEATGIVVHSGDLAALTRAMEELLIESPRLLAMQKHNRAAPHVSDVAMATAPISKAIDTLRS